MNTLTDQPQSATRDDDPTEPASEVPDVATSGSPRTDAAAAEVPDFHGLDAALYAGAPVVGGATDTSATWYWFPGAATCTSS